MEATSKEELLALRSKLEAAKSLIKDIELINWHSSVYELKKDRDWLRLKKLLE